ncbi:hypothetical protein M0R89_15785 [Halorussus limi]|uniref:DUF7344 domain-containing protein n=1 Tax=Halorussus limi TaxID=2938695 RepID=A0A8U0HSX6_9EURY|nr:hypothetical protein [Halorussus limi]UPV73987.1 hypothetical protein M0R89_15785 [Halorussus limi]
MPDDPSDGEATPSSEESDASDGGFGATADAQAPTADLRTGEESSERLDAAFALLAHSVRRDALYHLAESDAAALSVESLAEAVASKRASEEQNEDATDGTSESATDTSSLAVELHHAHLPKLESHGVVRYDPADRSVEYRGHEWLDEWLEHARRAEDG